MFSKIIKSITGGRRAASSPTPSPKTTMRWLDKFSGSSDYDRHHGVVEGLERFNGDVRGETWARLKALRLLENAGLPLQAGIVSQYLDSQDMPLSAKQSLWRECHLFWDQLTVAYLSLLKPVMAAIDEGRLDPWATEVAIKSLRYAALTMRWEYFRGERPRESAWQRLHKIYRTAEMAKLTHGKVEIEGRETNCDQEYARALLYDLANPHAYSLAESKLVMQILESIEVLPVPEHELERDRHTHTVDLSGVHGPKMITERWVPGNRLRYLTLQGVLEELGKRAAAAQSEEEKAICKHLCRGISRAGAHRDGPRRQRSGEVQAVFGMDAVIKVFAPYRGMVLKKETLALNDESREGLGLVMHEECSLQPGTLMAVSQEEGDSGWQLLSVRWQKEETDRCLLGTEFLSKHPRRVEVEWESDNAKKETEIALFLPLANTSRGAASNLLLPSASYVSGREVLLRDTSALYRLKLGEIVESHESWLRVAFDVLSRQAVEQAG